MNSLVLGRFELKDRIPTQQDLYKGAEVWSARDRQADALRTSLEVKAILYPADSTHGTSTARTLWSAELRKLFRLSCQPFDPALVGFVTGGFDAPNQRFALCMAESCLPSVTDWSATDDAGQSCFKQWRGDQARQRAQVWQHIASLFRAVGAIHESRIVHRRISPQHILVDQAVPRDESGFLKLGRFEASTFVSAFANTVSRTPIAQVDLWYSAEPLIDTFGPRATTGVTSTFAGDVFGTLASALWLLTGCPNKDETAVFEGKLSATPADDGLGFRREVFAKAIAKLPTRAEQLFFRMLLQTSFSPGVTSGVFHRSAREIARDLRQEGRAESGPLCLVISDNVDRRLQQHLAGVLQTGSSVHDLAALCRSAVMWPVEDEQTGEMIGSSILLPNGLLLKCHIWQYPDGTLDWVRNYVRFVSRFGSGSRTEPISLAGRQVTVMYQRERPPRNAASWEPLLDLARGEEDDRLDHTAEALEYLNKAELSFWEANIVPVKVARVTTKKTDYGVVREYVDITPLHNDPDFPPNPNIRNRPTPDFSQILQDKAPPIRVQLSPLSRLWDEASDRIAYISSEYVIGEADADNQRLHLRRDMRGSDVPLSQGHRAYLVTADQGWQMGLFRRRQNAIRSLPRHAILSTVLANPKARSVSVEPPDLDLPYERWNTEKSRLVSTALSVAPLFIVEGPPGTGKSTFVSGFMRRVLSPEEDPAARILIVAQQHTAIDELHTRVQQMFAGINGEEAGWGAPILLRLSSRQQAGREAASVPADETLSVLRPEVAAQRFLRPCLDAIAGFEEPESALLRKWLQSELATSTISQALEQRLIDAASLIFTTCTDRYLDDISSTEFDWVILEEAGRVVGTDLTIPMRLGHRWVLIGDPKQLGPYRKQDFDFAIKKTLQEAERTGSLNAVDRRRLESDTQRLLSPFESFYADLKGSHQQYSLSVQHRMHPEIRQVVSNVFYDRALQDDPLTSGAMPYLFAGTEGPLSARAVLWIDVPHLQWPDRRATTVDHKEENGYSYNNPSELQIIRKLIHHLGTYENRRNEAPTIRVAMITPYKRQMRGLNDLIRECAGSVPGWVELEGAFTADAYQGREADLIVLSMVRNNLLFDTGFLDQFRMNVALSRAHRMLVVVGCFKMFVQRAESPRPGEEFVCRLVDEFRAHLVPAFGIIPEDAR